MQKILPAALAPVPPFIRFDRLWLYYDKGSAPIYEKCKLIDRQLQFFKPALSNSNMIALSARIHYAKNKHFKDHSQLLDYFRNALLPIVDSAHGYKFVIYLSWDEEVASDMIASILQIPPVTRCSTLQIQIFGVCRRKKLPIEAISNWLNRRPSDVDKQKTKNPMISLRIHEGCIRRRSVRQMLDHLKEVRHFLQPFQCR